MKVYRFVVINGYPTKSEIPHDYRDGDDENCDR
jgi:hypothetical protein